LPNILPVAKITGSSR